MYYKTIKRRQVEKCLRQLGFVEIGGAKHTIYRLEVNNQQFSIPVPRHKVVSSGVVDSIVKKLVSDCGFNVDDGKKYLR
jgi:predicted RNA binding protein YcfA (HicA-like mRNA interferase family)